MTLRQSLQSFFCLMVLSLLTVSASATVSVNPVDVKKPIEVSATKPKFSVRLEANPSTGYSWIVQSYDKALVRVVSAEHDQFHATRLGQGGADTWTFEVLTKAFAASHTTQITLVYARPWEMVPQKTVVLTVVTQAQNPQLMKKRS